MVVIDDYGDDDGDDDDDDDDGGPKNVKDLLRSLPLILCF